MLVEGYVRQFKRPAENRNSVKSLYESIEVYYAMDNEKAASEYVKKLEKL